MGDLFKRPIYTREISGLRQGQDVSYPVFTGANVLPTAEGQPPEIIPTLGTETMRGQLMPYSRTESFKGASPGLAALADFLTAFGGPRGFGSGIPIAAEMQQQRNRAPGLFFQQQQKEADVGTQRTLQMRQMQRQEEQDNKPLISINQETGRVVVAHPRRLQAGDIAGGIQVVEPKKMTAEDAHAFIKGLETEYGVKLTPPQIMALAESADNPKALRTAVLKVMGEQGKAAQDTERQAKAEEKAAKDWENRFELERRRSEANMNRMLTMLNAANKPKEDDIQALADEVAEGRVPQENIPQSLKAQVISRVRKGGGVLMTRKQTESFQKAGQLERVVDEIERVSLQVNTGKPLMTPLTRAQKETAAFFGTDENAVRLKAARAQLGPIARGISQEVGVLTDRDIQRAEVAVPQVGESAAATKAKLSQLKTWIALAKQGIKEQAGARPQKYEITMPDGSKTTGTITAAEGLRLQDAGASLRKVE